METGRTVILLNLESLYESLYDALNQVRISVGRRAMIAEAVAIQISVSDQVSLHLVLKALALQCTKCTLF